jgi:uncharacterized protein with von Willebrand factor type A (vWA) domain
LSDDDPILHKAGRRRHKRLEEKNGRLQTLREKLEQYEEELAYATMDRLLEGEQAGRLTATLLGDRKRKELITEIRELEWEGEEALDQEGAEDLAPYKRSGLIEIDATDRISITARGARVLARESLRRILGVLRNKRIDTGMGEKRGEGLRLSSSSRPYEFGDEYEAVDFERTLLTSLSRTGAVTLRPQDFFVHESLGEARFITGLLVDESGSMGMNEKIGAAVETCLALSELVGRSGKGRLKVFLFSDHVREILPWNIVDAFSTGRTTDTRAALIAFRKAVAREPSNKQAYLITDNSPNTENGTFVGFERAIRGVMEEALRYRYEHIDLNIIMLDPNPRLRAFARDLARNSLGRVIFAGPDDLSEVVVEDYLKGRVKR